MSGWTSPGGIFSGGKPGGGKPGGGKPGWTSPGGIFSGGKPGGGKPGGGGGWWGPGGGPPGGFPGPGGGGHPPWNPSVIGQIIGGLIPPPSHHHVPYHNYHHWGYYADDLYYVPVPVAATPEYVVEDETLTEPTADDSVAQGPPPVPSAAELAVLNTEKLTLLIEEVAATFSKELDPIGTGDTWKSHFELASLQSNGRDRETLTTVLSRMDSAAGNPAYEAITGLWGFQTLHLAIRENSLPPRVRETHSLIARVNALGQSLFEMENGEGWITFLELKYLVSLADQTTASEADMKHCRDVLASFESVKSNSDYQAIANANGFEAARSALKKLTETFSSPSPKVVPPPPPADVAPPSAMERGWTNLKGQVGVLRKSLLDVEGGEGWVSHLGLDYLAQGTFVSNPTADDRKQCEKFLKRFTTAKSNPEYRVISELEGFDATSSALSTMIESLPRKTIVAPPPPVEY